VETLFGTEHNVTVLQECARAFLVFLYGFAVLRISGRRTFAKWSALDILVSIIVGSALARVITGDATIEGTFAAVAVMVAMHYALCFALARSEAFSRLIEGETVVLSRGKAIDEYARRKFQISKCDMSEAMREAKLDGLADLEKTVRLHLEPTGKITVVKKPV
jgi:uncharacterized membrane protein YcaP (DUF421 family)